MDRNGSKTVFITGASSGIGLATALYFHEQGWNVVATMRKPEKRHTPLHDLELPDIIHLDVVDPESIQAAVKYAVDKYKVVDVLVNNAGYAVYGPFETTSQEQIQREYETNVFGLMAVTRAFLPVFRQQKGGTLINVTSMGGRLGFPALFHLQQHQVGRGRFFGSVDVRIEGSEYQGPVDRTGRYQNRFLRPLTGSDR